MLSNFLGRKGGKLYASYIKFAVFCVKVWILIDRSWGLTFFLLYYFNNIVKIFLRTIFKVLPYRNLLVKRVKIDILG